MNTGNIILAIAVATSSLLISCSPAAKVTHDVRMFVLNDEMTRMLISDTGTVSIADINEFVYRKTTDYELVGIDAELNRYPDTKGEGIMHVKVAFIRYNKSSKIKMYNIVQPMHMLQEQTWKETLDQLKAFE